MGGSGSPLRRINQWINGGSAREADNKDSFLPVAVVLYMSSLEGPLYDTL